MATIDTTRASGSAGRSARSAPTAYSAAARPARRPNTLMSSNEFVPSRFAPCTDTHATSPAAYRPGHDVVVVAQDLALDVGRHAAHRVVRGGVDGHRLGVGLDAEVGARELGDVGQLGVDVRRLQVGQVEQDVVLVRPGAAAVADLHRHVAGHHVARGQVLHRRGVALHEPLALGVAQDRAFTAGRLGQQDAEPGQAGGVELVELHVLQRQPAPPHDAHPVTGQGVRVRRRLEHLAETAGGQDDRLGVEDVDLARGQLVGDDARRDRVAVRAPA